MIKVPFRAVLISLVALVAIGGLVVPNLPTVSHTGHSASGACTISGISLVVDFGPNSKIQPVIRCINGSNLSGWQVLEQAELKVEGTNEYPKAFVCRINDWPDRKSEDCMGTPGLTGGSWVYFYSKPGTKGWQRSPVGAATRKPLCGEVEGWLFVNQVSGDQKFESPKIKPSPFSCK